MICVIILVVKCCIKDCIGFKHCILKDDCVLKDDVVQIMDKIKNSDGIILTSPVYLQAVTGKLKTFVDRTCKWFHRPEIYGKPVLIIVTTKGSGFKSTLKYLEKVVTQ
jgi:multimeric flavodoxin WrbA